MSAAGIIAAGDGTRLAAARPGVPKPLVAAAGRPLAHWVVEGLAAAGAERVLVFTNTRGGALEPSLRAAFPRLRLEFMSQDTESSFQTFRLVCRRLAETEGEFLVSTVDALIPPAEVARFWTECRKRRALAGLALTSFVEDEKPLWAQLDGGVVSKLGDAARRDAVTCGLYHMTAPAVSRLPAAGAHGRLRDFWTALAAETPVTGVLLSKTLDVDRPEDLAAADTFLRTEMIR